MGHEHYLLGGSFFSLLAPGGGASAQYVADARAGRSSTLVSPEQAEIDALLAPERQRGAKAAAAAIDRAESFAQKHAASVDYERTQHEEGELLVATAQAGLDAAKTPGQKVDVLVMLARGYGDLNRWADAAHTYRDALAIAPNSPKLVSALSRAYYRLHDYPGMIARAQRYTQLQPRDGDGWSALGLAYRPARYRGPDLPGSVASTLKYRLIVAAPADAKVTLRAAGLRPNWVASFCADGLCSPQTVTFSAPGSGVKTYEFQLVPPEAGARAGAVAVSVDGGASVPVPPPSRI
jgi:tetratricopeptide (TPR) repeat protein